MKKRIASLILIFCLLLTTLSGAPVLAEIAEPPATEAESPEFAGESPSEIPPAEDEPAAEEESLTGEELPVEEELPAPVEEFEEDPQPAAAEPDPSAIPALGSSGTAYAGVYYLSRAAYESMPEDSQRAYVAMVDGFEALTEGGFVTTNAVYSLNRSGDVSLTMTLPTRQFAEAALIEEAVPEAEPAPEPEPAPEAELPAEVAPVEAPVERDAAPRAILPENVELAKSLMPEEANVRIGDAQPANFNNAELRALRTLFWKNQDLFYNQLSDAQKEMFSAAKTRMIDKGKNFFSYDLDFEVDLSQEENLPLVQPAILNFEIAISALVNTYPYKFDYVNWGDPKCVLMQYTYRHASRRPTLYFGFYKWRAWSANLEKRAKTKVKNLVNKAYASAIKDYPQNVTYGVIRYFDDWICKHNYYNNLGVNIQAGLTNAYYYCHSSYGILLKGYGVCESYALAMTRLLDTAGIPNLYVTGLGNGGGHAWNNVQMPDGKFYMQDTTWNDTAASKSWLLSANDGRHEPSGQRFLNSNGNPVNTFSFATLSGERYSANETERTAQLNNSTLYLAKGKSAKLSIAPGDYYEHYSNLIWKTDNKKIATVKNGKVKGVGSGVATISLCLSGAATLASCKVYVYKFTGLGFADNGDKSTYAMDYTGELNGTCSLNIKVKHNTGDATAQMIAAAKGLAAPTVSIDRKGASVVDSASAVLTGDTILLTFIPRARGDATIAVKFAGQSAKLTLRVREPLMEDWFSLDEGLDARYSGRAIKPAVKLTASAPDGMAQGKQFAVSYANNVNAGTGTVVIQGRGVYGGKIEKSFTIRPANFDPGKVKISNAKAQVFNGSPRSAKPTVTLGKKTLRPGVDYKILYDGSETPPTAPGTYTLTFPGLNYEGTLTDGKTHFFTIKAN